jgi:hypothetical protein
VCLPITFNHGVEGSSPSALTNKPHKFKYLKGGQRGSFLLRELCPHCVRKRLSGIEIVPASSKPAGESDVADMGWSRVDRKTSQRLALGRRWRCQLDAVGGNAEIGRGLWGRSDAPRVKYGQYPPPGTGRNRSLADAK